MTLEEIAKLRGKDPFETMFDIMLEEGPGTAILGADRTEEDVAEVLAYPESTLPIR